MNRFRSCVVLTCWLAAAPLVAFASSDALHAPDVPRLEHRASMMPSKVVRRAKGIAKQLECDACRGHGTRVVQSSSGGICAGPSRAVG